MQSLFSRFYSTTGAQPVSGMQRRGLGAAIGIAALAWASHASAAPGHGPRDPQAMLRHMESRINFLITAVDGTPEQKARLQTLHKTAMTELAPLREQMRKARKDGLALLAEPSINRAAVEQLRVSQLQLGDSLSRRMTQLMIEAAEVLTPAQRSKAAELMRQRGERHRRSAS